MGIFDKIGNVAGGFVANPWAGQAGLGGYLGQDKGRSTPGYSAPTLEGSPENAKRTEEIFNNIFKNRVGGSYNETTISNALREMKNLENQLHSGDLSQSDYVAIAGALSPYIQKDIQRIGSYGSAAINSATNLGLNDLKKSLTNLEIYKSGQDLLGRDLTPNELAELKPRFGTGKPDDLDIGRSYVAELAKQEANSPKALQSKAGQYSGDVNGIFNDLLKRGATQEELNHFGSLLASGEVDPYTLRQFVSQMPEVTEQRDTAERAKLGQELSGYDQDFFNKAKENVLSRYSQAGIQNSPSLDFALTNLMGDIQKERSAYMAGLAREDYGSRRGTAREDYLTSMNRMFGNQDYGRQRSDAYSDLLTNRAFGSIDYQRQQNDLLNLLNSQPRQNRPGTIGQSLAGGVAGGGAFASTGNPYLMGGGALIGAVSPWLT